MVMTWVPKSEIAWASRESQKGQRGGGACSGAPPPRPSPIEGEWESRPAPIEGEGISSLSTGHVAAFRQSLDHVQRRLVDPSVAGTAAVLVPTAPVDADRRLRPVQALPQPGAQLQDRQAEGACSLQLVDVRSLRPEPLDGLPPGARDRFPGVRLLHPAVAVKVVVTLLLQHLPQPGAQDLDLSPGEGLDHQGEGGVEHHVGGDELAPGAPGTVEEGEVAVASILAGPFPIELLEAAVEDPAVPDVVEPHRRRRDVRLKGGGGGAPLRVSHPKKLLVVRQAADQRLQAQESGPSSPGAQSVRSASLGTITSSTQRSSS